MHSRSELWVYFPLQELLANDADVRVVRLHMRVSIFNYYSSAVAHTSHSQRICRVCRMLVVADPMCTHTLRLQ